MKEHPQNAEGFTASPQSPVSRESGLSPRGEFMRIHEAAEKIYGCTVQNLYKQVRRGNLKTYKRFGYTVVNVQELKELADFIEPRGGDRKFIPKKKCLVGLT